MSLSDRIRHPDGGVLCLPDDSSRPRSPGEYLQKMLKNLKIFSKIGSIIAQAYCAERKIQQLTIFPFSA